MEYRTEGSRGSTEMDILKETMSAKTDGFAQSGLRFETTATTAPGSSAVPPGLKEEEGLKVGPL